MRDVQRIAIVDPADDTREPLRNLLLGIDSVWLEAECARYEFFFEVIRQSAPDIAIVCLDADQGKAMQLITQVSQDIPEMPILAVSGRNDGQAILQALRCGAREFLTAPVQLEELLTVLKRIPSVMTTGGAMSSVGSGPSIDSKVCAIVGSRGGVGCTTFAVNLGATLAKHENVTAAIVDLDLALGDADVALDLMGDYTLADVALNIDRIDMAFLKRSLCQHSSGVSLLPHPTQMEDCQLIREEHLQRLISLLRASYTHLLLDLSKSFSPNDVTALQMADVIYLVTQLELSSLRNAVRMLHALGNDPALAEKIHVIVNRVGMATDITVKKAEEILNAKVHWEIPDDPKAINEARNTGAPLVQTGPRSKVQQSLDQFALELMGRTDADNKQRSAKTSGWFASVLGG